MARSVNEENHQAKREAILDAAERLVETKGYEQMAIQDVLNALHISKGALYHYFDSKPSLLLAIIERRGDALVRVVQPVVRDPELSALDKLSRFFLAHDEFKRRRKQLVLELTRIWFADGNAIFRQKLSTERRRRIAPWLAEIIVQGVAQGVFTTTYPDQAARIITSIMEELGETLAEILLAAGQISTVSAPVQEATDATADAIERILGAQEGVLRASWREALSGW